MAATYKKRILVSFLIAILVLLAVAGSVYASFREMNRQKDWVDHTYEVINSVDSILSYLKDVQSSQRGYIITGLEDYLAPYNAALPKIQENLQQLQSLVQDNPKQAERARQLSIHVNQRVRAADQVLMLYKTQGQKAAFEKIMEGTGKREMDEVRFIVTDMTGEEQKLLNTRRDAMAMSSKLTMFAGITGVTICFIVLIVVFSLIHKEAEQRVRTEESLHKAVEDMEKITSETQMIGRIGDYLRACKTEAEAYSIIQKNMPVLFPGTFGSVAMFNDVRTMVQTVLRWGFEGEAAEFAPEDCWALRQGRIHRYLKGGTTPLCEHAELHGDNEATICLPMQAQGDTIGQVFLGSADRNALSEHQLSTLRTAGEQISLALANIKLQHALKEQSIKDALTRLFNRRYLEETLPREIARTERNKTPMAVLIMDIDFFKKVNDTYGHDGGDAVLVAFAGLLLGKSRKEDIACRLGGEEFVLVLPAANAEIAMRRAQEICAATRLLDVKFQNQSIKVTVSVGIAMFPEHGVTPESLLKAADLSLYKAKHDGRDRAVMTEEMQAV